MRFAIVVAAALAIHIGLLAWFAPSQLHLVLIEWVASGESDPAPELTTEAPAPTDTIVEIVLLDEPAQKPIVRELAKAAPAASGAVPVAERRDHASAAPNASAATPVAADLASAAPATSDATPSDLANAAPAANPSDVDPVATPSASGPFAIRHVDLSPARVVDRLAVREGASPAGALGPPTGEITVGGLGPSGQRTFGPSDGARDGELRPAGKGTYTTDLGGSDWRNRTATATVARDGTVKFENAPDFDMHFALFGVVGKFNADDWIARKAGIDPYASAKLRYLDRTRDARVRVAEVHRADDLAQAQRALQRNLDAARRIADPAARKQALFELWDDVAEDGDEALVRAGAGARAYLVGAIRAMRPALTFTPDELAQLNAHRHSRAVFAPYE